MTDTTPAGTETPPAGGTAPSEWRVAGKLGPEKTDALVISCSDRRYRRPMEHFLFKELGLENYDLLAVPGGVYMLSFATVLPKQLKLGMQMVKFIVKNHLVPRIVLIAHKDCGRYREGFASWMRRPDFDIVDKQKHDLQETVEVLRDAFKDVRVDAYYAEEDIGDSVTFRPVGEA